MKNELDIALCTKYPKIFANRHAPMTETAMCWGIETGDGWYHIIDNLCGIVQSTIDYNHTSREKALAHNKAIEENRIQDLPLWSQKNPVIQNVPDMVPQVIADQVKEKYGGLRFYYTGGNDKISHYIDFAEYMSYTTCEECGQPGQMYGQGGGWIRTLCKEHAKKYYSLDNGDV